VQIKNTQQLKSVAAENQTLLDKYMGFWTGKNHRDDDLRSNSFITDITSKPTKEFEPSVVEEYKKFLMDFDDKKSKSMEKIHKIYELDDLISKKKF
jgi:hypothetical protein